MDSVTDPPRPGTGGEAIPADERATDEQIAAEYATRHDEDEYEVLLVAPISRTRRDELPLDIREAVARQNATNTETILTPFGRRTFRSIAEFESAWKRYAKNNYLRYRVRHSLTAKAHNKVLERKRVKANRPRDEAFESKVVPVAMGYAIKTLRCTHGFIQKTRGEGTRVQASTRYTACNARITVISRRLRTGGWAVQTVSEVIRHNHRCSPLVYESYQTSSLIEEHHLFDEVRYMIQANAPSAGIRDVFGMRTGATLTSQQLANFRRDRLGGRGALDNLRLLIERFSSFSGARCLIIEDQDEQVCGIVVQSAAQRAMFEQYGGSLILDWTHNTNNVGYYLGALMVTTATGHGMSVCDFLCVEQTKAMMRTVFTHFVNTNPEATTKVISIVIDKDYVEWDVLMEVFPNARVILCQFHVLKWFAHVVTSKRFDLSISLRERVLTILTSMVYAATTDDFQTQQRLLFGLLEHVSPGFLEYMATRWYNCRPMWSSCERGTVFTAMNTTSNRLESSWGQVKKILGMKLRIDMCLEAVFSYQTSVLRREFKIINTFATRMFLRSQSDPFIRPVLQQVSDCCAKAVTEQWRACVSVSADYVTFRECTPGQEEQAARVYAVDTMRPGSRRHQVDVHLWSCTCESYVTSALPCRHLLFVARHALGLPHYPVRAIPSRWMLNDAVGLLPRMRVWTEEVQSLRTGHLHADAEFARHVQMQAERDGTTPGTMPRKFAHVTLRRHAVASGVVSNNLEKRAVIRAGFEEVTNYLMRQSSPRFKILTARLQLILEQELTAWRRDATASADFPEPTTDGREGRRDDVDDEVDVDGLVASAMIEEDAQFEADCAYADFVAPQDDYSSVIEGSSAGLVVNHARHSESPARQTPSPGRSQLPAEVLDAKDAVTHSEADVDMVSVASAPNAMSAQEIAAEFGFELESDEDDVSSLSLSDASALIQGAAINHAQAQQTTFKLDEAKYGLENFDVNEAVRPGRPKSVRTPTVDDGVLSSMKLNVRGTTRLQKYGETPKRLASLQQSSDCSVVLQDFLHALECTRDIAAVKKLWHAYPTLFTEKWLLTTAEQSGSAELRCIVPSHYEINFVIPQSLQLLLSHAITQRRIIEGPEASDFAANGRRDEYVATIAQKIRGFTDGNIAMIREFYNVGAICRRHEGDLAWVESEKDHAENSHTAVPYLMELSARATSVFGSVDVGDCFAAVRKFVASKMREECLRTRYRLASSEARGPVVCVSEVAGFLARKARLSSTVLLYCLHQLSESFAGLHIVDSLRPGDARAPPPLLLPSVSIAEINGVVFPVNLGHTHWGVVFVRIAGGTMVATLYEPLVDSSYQDSLRREWEEYCKPMLVRWSERDLAHSCMISSTWATTPKQTDSSSCGIYCVTKVYECASGIMNGAQNSLTDETLRDLRLLMLWRIVCQSARDDISPREEQEAARTLQIFAGSAIGKKKK